jgi:holo-[acyl-carrier protein] synthase
MSVGLDLLEIERLEAALERRPRLAERLFTEAERAYAAQRSRPAQHLAARFCAKEAVAKALALEAWSWQDIEVVSPPEGGPPRIALHGALAGRGVEVDVSLTHSRGTAGAVAVVRR